MVSLLFTVTRHSHTHSLISPWRFIQTSYLGMRAACSAVDRTAHCIARWPCLVIVAVLLTSAAATYLAATIVSLQVDVFAGLHPHQTEAEAADDAQQEASATAGGKRPAGASTALSPNKLAKTAASSSASSTASKHASVTADAEPVAPDVVQATEFGKHVVKRIMQAGVPPKSVLNFIQYFDADYKSATHKTNVKQLVVHLMANYGDDSDDE